MVTLQGTQRNNLMHKQITQIYMRGRLAPRSCFLQRLTSHSRPRHLQLLSDSALADQERDSALAGGSALGAVSASPRAPFVVPLNKVLELN